MTKLGFLTTRSLSQRQRLSGQMTQPYPLPTRWSCGSKFSSPIGCWFVGFLLTIAAAGIALPTNTRLGAAESDGEGTSQIVVNPTSATLQGAIERLQLVVTRQQADEVTADLTAVATYVSADPEIATVDSAGQIMPRSNGKTIIAVQAGKEKLEVAVTVNQMEQGYGTRFTWHVIPMLNRSGCTGGGCHASQFGQAGFKLSLFGFAPEQDYPEIAEARFGRRINLIEPDESLLLLKPSLQLAHGGGRRFTKDSYEYQVLRSWIADDTPAMIKTDAKLLDLKLYPQMRVFAPGQTQQVRAEAIYDDGTHRDVTAFSMFDCEQSPIAIVDSSGLITAQGPGQTAVMVRYMGQAKIVTVMVPFSETTKLDGFKPNNFVDQIVMDRWQRLGLQPVGTCTDNEFIRRAFLDATGSLPAADRVEQFLGDDLANKREILVDELLGLTGDPKRDRFVEQWSAYWALKWGDLLRNNRNSLGDGGMWSMHNWLRNSFRENKPIDKIAREIITAQGSMLESGPANFYKITSKPEDLAEATAQVFLGIRLMCARCHHHPFEVYSQQDYYSLAAFFTRIGTKSSSEFGAFGGDSVVMVKRSGSISHPRTRQVMVPTPLLGKAIDPTGIRDLREPLADWLTSPENQWFAQNTANRTWSYFMGTGLVEPVDDIRATNPASNPALLKALAKYFVENKFDLRRLMRVIMNSRVYQLSATAPGELVTETRFYAHYNVKRLPAEVMLDAVNYVTDTQDKFQGVPAGTRAIELPDPNYASYFLDTMGRPPRNQACECERTSAPNLAQVLHLVNGEVINRKLSEKNGFLMKALNNKELDDDTLAAKLFMRAFSRLPTDEEKEACRELVAGAPNRNEGWQDVLWAILNSREFLFNH